MNNEKLVSPYISSQFPTQYREEDPQFVEFVMTYYQWLESEDQAVGRSKRIAEYRDIDETLEDFIVYFKTKYMPFFKFDTATDKRMIIKHVLDLYRSKGTERGIDLFFKLVYGTAAEVYYPSVDLFRLSDNSWVRRSYLELSQHPTLTTFTGKAIYGKRSGATAFAEKYVTRKIGNRYAYVLYISNIVGNFETGEQIAYNGINTDTLPFITGSLNTLDVTAGSSGFTVGDVVSLQSDSGSGGLARVTSVSNTTGIVDFRLVDGGWGYTACSEVYVSEKILSISNVVPDVILNNLETPGYADSPFFMLETISQPMANINFESGTGTVAIGDVLTTYDNLNVPKATAKVIRLNTINSTSGNSLISILTGNAQYNTYFWSPGNTYSINVVSYTDKTATGKFVGISANQTLSVANVQNRFPTSTFIYQTDDKSRITAIGKLNSADYLGTTGTLRLTEVNGVFSNSSFLYMKYANGYNPGYIANLVSLSTVIGVSNVTGTFIYTGNAYIKSATSNATANVTYINNGEFASFKVSNSLSHADTYSLYTDFLRANSTLNIPFMSTALNAVDYGFPKAVAGSNSSTIIGNALDSFSGQVGTITRLTDINPGKDYDAAPFVFIYDKYTSGYNKRDYILTVNLTSSNFSVGEEITQTNGAKGIIKDVVSASVLLVRRTSLLVDFDKSYVSSVITGSSSGATASLVDVAVDTSSATIGRDAIVTANVVTANGVVTKLEVVDSGFNYVQDETVDFVSADEERVGSAKANLIRYGTSQGTFITQDSFLSDSKYLFDGYYYQDYSYDIRSGITRNKFEEIYKQTMHLAGTQMFSTYVHTSINPKYINASLPEGANTQPV